MVDQEPREFSLCLVDTPENKVQDKDSSSLAQKETVNGWDMVKNKVPYSMSGWNNKTKDCSTVKTCTTASDVPELVITNSNKVDDVSLWESLVNMR